MNKFEILYENIMKDIVLEHIIPNHNGRRYWIVPDKIKDKPYLNQIIHALEVLPFKYITKEIDKEGHYIVNSDYRILNIFNEPTEKPTKDMNTGALTAKNARKKNNWERIWNAVYRAVPELRKDALNPEFDNMIREFNWQIKKIHNSHEERIASDLHANFK